MRRLGPVVVWIFLPYFLLWSFFVGSAQMSANGVALHAMFPVFDDARDGKIVFGVLSSLAGLAIVLRGGYRGFDVAMKVCIGVMFVTVVDHGGRALARHGRRAARACSCPRSRASTTKPSIWTVALIGGIGGTLTVLSYGYWMREEGRTSPEDLRTCRIDLAASYFMMALFGIADGHRRQAVRLEGEGTAMLVVLSDRLGEELGPAGKWLFLVGTLGTVFSSLLGVWQATPYLFAECWRLGVRRDARPVDTRAPPYRWFLLVLAIVPMLGLFGSFREVQKLYTVIGAYIFPTLALVLIVFNSRSAWVGQRFGLGQDLLQHLRVGGMVAPERGRAGERDDAPGAAEPVAVLEDVGERVPVVAEVVGQAEAAVEFGEERRLVLRASEVDGGETELRGARGRAHRLERTGPVAEAGVVRDGEIGHLHSRILRKDW